MSYIANSEGQCLREHLLAVAKRSVEVLESLNLEKSKFNHLKDAVYLSGLFHDLGKVDSTFQKYLKKRKNEDKESTDAEENRKETNKWHGVFHQETSWAAIQMFLSLSSTELDVVSYATYWHHPSVSENKRTTVKTIWNPVEDCDATLTKNMSLFINELLSESSVKFHLNKTPTTLNLNIPSYFEHSHTTLKTREVQEQAYRTIALSCLIEADREVSSWPKEELRPYISRLITKPVVTEETNNFSELKQQNGERSLAQQTLSNELASTNLSVCAVDTGAGKTRVAMLWKGATKRKNKMVIALPKRRQVDALFDSITQDYPYIFDGEISVQGVHGGIVQKHSETLTPEILGSDVNIVVFDQMLKTFYKREEIKNFMRILRSDVVFDEYHEFLFIPNMLPSLMVITMIRSWMTEVSTLFLSGTANPGLNQVLFESKEIPHKIKDRGSLPEVHQNKKTYSFSQEPNVLDEADEETLQSFNRVEDAVKSWVLQNDLSLDNIYHSKYSERDLVEKIQSLLTNYKKGHTTPGNVISALLLQSSFDISLRNAKQTLSFPDTVAQFFGRVDRHGDKPDGKVVIYCDPTPKKSFSEDKAGFLEVYNLFKQHVKTMLDTPKEMTHREATVKIYDDFWTPEAIGIMVSKLEYKIKAACVEMGDKYPTKRFLTKTQKKIVAGGGLFRGDSQFVAAKKVDLYGNTLGITGQEEILSITAPYMIDELRRVFDKALNHAANRDLFGEFETGQYIGGQKYARNKWKHGKLSETPLYFSHNDTQLDESIKRCLTSDKSIGYYVYNKQLGLIKESVLENIKERGSEV